MATIKYLLLQRSNLLILLLLLFSLLMVGCNVSGNSGAVWLGEPVVTAQLDKNGEPIEAATKFGRDTTILYCYLSLRSPENVKLFVRWYQDEQLIVEDLIIFGKERKAAPSLTYQEQEPFPPGKYRCEYGFDPERTLRSVKFTIE